MTLTFVQKAVAHKPQALIEHLNKRLSGEEESRGFHHIHASQITGSPKFCPRQAALNVKLKIKPPLAHVNMATRVTYDNGSALARMVIEDWLSDIAVGTWVCLCCGIKHVFCKRPKGPCAVCQRSLWRYEEERFKSEVTGTSGGIDLLVDLGIGKHTVVEIKTMDKDLFNSLKAPQGEHRVRTCFYLWHVRTSTRPEAQRIDQNRAKILYISKGFGSANPLMKGKIMPFREWDVVFDEDMISSEIASAVAYKRWRDEGIMPKGICATSICSRAKACNVVQECWGPEHVPGEPI